MSLLTVPSLTVPSKPPSLTPPKPRKKLADAVPVIGKVLCSIGKHDVIDHEWEDRNGGWDGMSQCARCHEWDVGNKFHLPKRKEKW